MQVEFPPRSTVLIVGATEALSKINGFFEDYALLIRGLVALHRAGGQSRYLEEAVRLAGEARQRFWDPGGGYFDSLADQADLFVRTKSTYDGAVPCGNSVMLNNLLDLHELNGDAFSNQRTEILDSSWS